MTINKYVKKKEGEILDDGRTVLKQAGRVAKEYEVTGIYNALDSFTQQKYNLLGRQRTFSFDAHNQTLMKRLYSRKMETVMSRVRNYNSLTIKHTCPFSRKLLSILKPNLKIIHWNQEGWKTGLCVVPPVGQSYSLLTLANNTCIQHSFTDLRDRFVNLYKRKLAHVHHYTHIEGIEVSDFKQSFDSLKYSNK
ncbi:TUBE [Mytilus coruscus]|uniref:TUBE n=1 Tax=Mytilus coruscus TaxID=42192 RepID=A0A6J8A6P2_MYTCO|nr:TUBE [Mytilus coruscus]